jgi:hypothetical protein
VISIAYNADAIFRNPDDYKNWQLEQFKALSFAPDTLEETLSKLRKQDPYWQNIRVEGLQNILSTAYRSVGIWQLSAETSSSVYAPQAVLAWEEVILEKYGTAFSYATRLWELNNRIHILNQTLTQVNLKHSMFTSVQAALNTWQDSAIQKPGHEGIDELQRWRLWSLVAQVSDFDPSWKSILEEFPSPEATVRDYLIWGERVVISLDIDIESLQDQTEGLVQERLTALDQHSIVSTQSRGLSENFIVEKAANSPPKVIAIRPASLLAIVGGVLGLLVWSMAWLFRVTVGRK